MGCFAYVQIPLVFMQIKKLRNSQLWGDTSGPSAPIRKSGLYLPWPSCYIESGACTGHVFSIVQSQVKILLLLPMDADKVSEEVRPATGMSDPFMTG